MRHRPVLNSASYWLGCAILFLGVLVPELANAQILDSVGNAYKTASGEWKPGLTAIAKSLFLKLALIEVVWSAIWWLIERDDPNQIFVAMLKKMMGLMFFWAILLNFDTWIPAVIEGFVSAGQEAGKTGALTPSSVLDRGLEISAKLASSANKAGFFSKEGGIGTTILSGLSALGILLCFAVIAGQMLVTLVESYIVVSGGVLFLGFAGSRWTSTFAEKYISYGVSVGVKLFMTYLIIGAGQSLSDTWSATLTANMKAADYLEVFAGSMVYMFLAWQIPSLASSMLTGAVSMTLGSAAATVGTMAAGAAGAAGLAQAGLAGAGNGVAGALQAGSAAIDQSRAGGASGFLKVAAGATGALASAGAGAASDAIRGLGGGSTGGNLANRMADTTASLTERAAAGAPAASVPGAESAVPAAPVAPAPSAPGQQPAAPAAPAPSGNAGGTAAPSSVPGAAASAGAAGAAATPAAPQRGVIDTSGNVSQALADRDSGAVTNPPAPAAAPEAAPVDTTAAASAPSEATTPAAPAPAPASAPAAPAAASTAPASPTRPPLEAGEARPNALQQLSEHASALGAMPNDSAAGAGVQINLKHD